MKRHLLSRVFVAAGALALSGAALAGKPLFVGAANPNTTAMQAATALSHRQATQSMRVVRADASVVARDSREIELDLGTRRVNAVLDKAHTTPMGSLVWSGHLKEAKARPLIQHETGRDELNSATFVRRGNGITGDVFVDGKLYRIRPLPDGTHAVIEVDASRMPPEHPQSFYDRVQFAPRHDAAGVASGAPTMTATAATDTTIRVMVYVTPQAVSAYSGDMQALAELAVAESNTGYANSNVGINMVLAGYHVATGYTESTNWDTNVSRWVGKTDGYIDGAHAQRDTDAADVNVLIFNQSSYCGEASGLPANEATAFAVAYWDCATGYYSFAHEVGHLQGARHDPANDPTNTPYAYGHGYQYQPASGTSWRTIMGYNCSPSCTRINYWSSPDITYGGVAMGTADKNDNARVLRTTKATVAAFRPDPGANTPPVANFSFSTSNLTATFTDSSTDSDGSIASRSWNFGDGTTSTATNPSKAYSAGGTYSVALTVTDNGGATNTVTKSVTVTTTSGNLLSKGVAATGLSAATGGYVKYTMDVPAGATNLTFTMSGGTGDADMYVKFGSEPTDSVYDCRPYKSGNAETCTFATPSTGKYYINLKGYAAFSGVSLVGDYSTGPVTQTYTNTTDYTIGDNTTVDSPITVSGRSGNGLSSTQVAVSIVHTYIGDLKVDLVAPDGSIYTLHNHTGSSTDNINQTYTVNLSGEVLNGTWKLRVNDNAGGDTGYINSWSVTF